MAKFKQDDKIRFEGHIYKILLRSNVGFINDYLNGTAIFYDVIDLDTKELNVLAVKEVDDGIRKVYSKDQDVEPIDILIEPGILIEREAK